MSVRAEVYHNLSVIKETSCADQVTIGVTVAASELFRFGKYHLNFKSPDGTSTYASPGQLADLYMPFILDYSRVSIKDSF